MAAYRRVYVSRHLQADCQEPGSAPEPYARNRVWTTFTFKMQWQLVTATRLQYITTKTEVSLLFHLQNLSNIDTSAIMSSRDCQTQLTTQTLTIIAKKNKKLKNRLTAVSQGDKVVTISQCYTDTQATHIAAYYNRPIVSNTLIFSHTRSIAHP